MQLIYDLIPTVKKTTPEHFHNNCSKSHEMPAGVEAQPLFVETFFFEKGRQQLELMEQQHPNTVTLTQVHSLSVSKKNSGETSERVITDLCEKQIKMSVSNY